MNNYDRRAVEEEYELEDGELDGVDIRTAEKIVGEEDGALDRFIYFDDDGEDEESTELNSLEDILTLINGEPIKKIGGNIWYHAYDKLISILYAVGKITEIDMNKIVDKLDEIDSNGEIY